MFLKIFNSLIFQSFTLILSRFAGADSRHSTLFQLRFNSSLYSDEPELRVAQSKPDGSGLHCVQPT